MDPADILGNQEQFMQIFGDGYGEIDPEKDPFKHMYNWESDQENEEPDAKENEKQVAKEKQNKEAAGAEKEGEKAAGEQKQAASKESHNNKNKVEKKKRG